MLKYRITLRIIFWIRLVFLIRSCWFRSVFILILTFRFWCILMHLSGRILLPLASSGSTFATTPNKFVTFSSGTLVFLFVGWARGNLSSLFIIVSCFNSLCWCICCCIGSRNGVVLAVAAELLVVPILINFN